MFQLVGGAFGLAMATTIFTDFAQNDLLKSLSDSTLHLSKPDLDEITDFIVGSGSAQKILESLGQQEFNTVFSHIEHAYITGVSGGLIFTSILSAIGAALAILFVRSKVSRA